MADYTGGIDCEGLDKVLDSFDKTDAAVRKAAMEGLEAGAMDIIADAQQNLRANSSVVTGLLRQSGKVQKAKDKDELDAGFFDTKNQSGYAAWVEYGRRAGKMPPPDELAAYAYKKFRLGAKEAEAMGWALARKIAKKGTKPHPFFKPAIDKNRDKILQRIREALNR